MKKYIKPSLKMLLADSESLMLDVSVSGETYDGDAGAKDFLDYEEDDLTLRKSIWDE